jgi:hypothetical protein
MEQFVAEKKSPELFGRHFPAQYRCSWVPDGWHALSLGLTCEILFRTLRSQTSRKKYVRTGPDADPVSRAGRVLFRLADRQRVWGCCALLRRYRRQRSRATCRRARAEDAAGRQAAHARMLALWRFEAGRCRGGACRLCNRHTFVLVGLHPIYVRVTAAAQVQTLVLFTRLKRGSSL